ncbi:hypothetical protein MIB92_14755 [Aestuariirhabdus sp. Z084]|uniref:hypothetical protein n=1 Tax=Aestuariirhabdus haliotis TaxID=2918751 RepID=UPI00201B39B5|nr:hypothetical protein [Aestuariirhabdus haliotis]MCL6416919.1 hypothetical protein [Aestuariirhabdus haliotis]MCL6420919.1 hypothetical protein [Aestuariirhabdus haliotis]
MSNKNAFMDALEREIGQARRQRLRAAVAHNFIILLTIVCGALTTYWAAVGLEDKQLLAILAAITTLSGTLEKTFAFGKAKAGYRSAKTQFEKLRNELMKIDGDTVPDPYIDKLNRIKELKVELTDGN